MTFPMSVGASTVLFPDRPTPQAVLDIMRRHRPTLLFGAPTFYGAMLADKAIGRGAGSDRLRLCVSAGEALPPNFSERLGEVGRTVIRDGFDSTQLPQTV